MRYQPYDISPLQTLRKKLEARCYNDVRLAFRRVGNPLVLYPEELPTMELILEPRSWLCLDARNSGMPVLEWTGFRDRGRGLHQAVPCLLHCYHPHATMLISKVLHSLRRELDYLLRPDLAMAGGR